MGPHFAQPADVPEFFVSGVGRIENMASVSRWEAGGAPSLDEMQAIREAAAARKIKWNDAWFFETPAEEDAA